MQIRPIRPSELPAFAAIGADNRHTDDIRQYLDQMIAAGSMRPDWCFVADDGDQLRGRVAFWTLPKVGVPLAIVLLDAPSQHADHDIGLRLLDESIAVMRAHGAADLEHVLDLPAQWPQWQADPERRHGLLTEAGFTIQRETRRFAWQPAAAPPPLTQDLRFRSLSEVGAAAFIDAIERVSAGSLDQRTRHDRAELGAACEAQQTWNELQSMDYDPAWWQLAYTAADELVGLVMPALNPTSATIGYIGVTPEQRGRGYIDDLLARGTTMLLNSGRTAIRADTDVANIPMAQAFGRAGYSEFAMRREYILRHPA